MVGYVDIHSHILYGVDDGARTLAESLEMLELARAAGTTDIVATPHANAEYAFNPELIARRIAELSGHAALRIHSGCDFHLQFDNIADAVAQAEAASGVRPPRGRVGGRTNQADVRGRPESSLERRAR